LRGAQSYRRAKDFPAPNHRATDRGSIPLLLKLTMPTETDVVILMFKPGGAEGNRSKSAEQRVPLTWTTCHLGGARPWFRCYCRRRIAILYMRGASTFACRHCCGLAYASQSENPRYRAISKSQKFRMRLGGGPSILDPFAEKPPRMHWLLSVASQGDGGAGALARAGARYMGRHYPGL